MIHQALIGNTETGRKSLMLMFLDVGLLRRNVSQRVVQKVVDIMSQKFCVDKTTD